MSSTPNVREREKLIKRSLLREPCKRCSYFFGYDASTMNDMRCERCNSSLKDRWQLQLQFELLKD